MHLTLNPDIIVKDEGLGAIAFCINTEKIFKLNITGSKIINLLKEKNLSQNDLLVSLNLIFNNLNEEEIKSYLSELISNNIIKAS